MSSEINFKGRKFLIALTIIATLLSYPSLIAGASAIETLYFPVVSELVIDKSIRTYDNGTIIEGMYNRNRQCRFIAVGWFLRKGELDVSIPVERVPRDVNRPVGTYRFGPWKLFASREEIEDSGYAVVYHRCHPLYVTESYIYAKGTPR